MARLQGAIDYADVRRIEGWVRDAADFTRPMVLELSIDGTPVVRFAATPIGDGASLRHVFRLAPAQLLLRGALTRFALRDSVGGEEVPGSPFAIAEDTAIHLPPRRTQRSGVVFIDERAPAPTRDGGSVVALSHLRALRSLGHAVTFLTLDPTGAAALDPARAAGAWCPQVDCPAPAAALLRHLRPAPSLVYLHRFPTAAQLLPLLRIALPHCRIIHAAADLQWLRMERGGAPATDIAQQRQLETTLLALPDIVVVHSPVEADLLAGIARDVAVVPWAMPIRPPPSFGERRGYAFVGGFDHAPNGDAVAFLAERIVPRLTGGPAGTVYGSALPDRLRALQRPGLRTVGEVADIVARLHRHRATIAPLRFGAGIKVKVVQSLACGLPCVMTPIAAEGVDLPPLLKEALVRDTPDGLAEALRVVCRDPSLNAELAAVGMRHVRQRFSAGATRDALGRLGLGLSGLREIP